jgi:hypothetical protein
VRDDANDQHVGDLPDSILGYGRPRNPADVEGYVHDRAGLALLVGDHCRAAGASSASTKRRIRSGVSHTTPDAAVWAFADCGNQER